MALGVLELNDIGITVHRNGRLLIESPGFALLEGHSLLVGTEAYTKSRLNPHRTHTRFWDQLSVDPLTTPGPKARHYADIAYAHLAHIWDQVKSEIDEIIFVVPGTFDTQQLGLLLGIAKECAIPVVGLVDTAVVASSEIPISERLLFHLDIQLHRIVLTRLNQSSRLERDELSQLNKTGLVSLRETWANSIADAFVRATRFDPMHAATTEQQLYDRLPTWLASLQREETVQLTLQVSDKTHHVSLNRDRLAHASAETYEQIVQMIHRAAALSEPTTLQVSHRFCHFPGFFDRLGELNHCEIIRLGSEAAARGAVKHRQHICRPEDSLSRLTTLPWKDPSLALRAPTIPKHTGASNPTHLLYRAHGYPINEQPLTLGTAIPQQARGFKLSGPATGVSRRHCAIYSKNNQVWVEDYSTYGTFLNGQKIKGRAVAQTGDRLRLGTPGEELQFIALMPPPNSHGT